MNRSENSADHLLPEHSAPQHEHAPRPLPLFLEMIRRVGEHDPDTARAALDGLAKYESVSRQPRAPRGAIVARMGPAVLRDHGGAGPPAILVPSLINPPDVLDLDEEVSLASAISRMGRRGLLLDWGRARERPDLDIGSHIQSLLLPLVAQLDEPPALIGYCLGGTMAIAAANLVAVDRVATVAAPWRFSNYPPDSRQALLDLWHAAEFAAESLKVLPMEVLQAAFWSLDPARTVAKFAEFSKLDAGGANARRFVVLEDWANEGEPLPLPAARELIEDLFGSDLPGTGMWTIGGRAMSDRLDVPLLNCTASKDRITPAVSAPAGETRDIPSGHVGMIVGSARHRLHEALSTFLDPACR